MYCEKYLVIPPSHRARNEGARDKPGAQGVDVGATDARKTIATRVLASFAVTLVAFAITAGWSVVAQRRAVLDNEALSKGYVQVALQLGQLRAVHATLYTLVEGIPDQRNPLSTRLFFETFSDQRRAKLVDAKDSMLALRQFRTANTLDLSLSLADELDKLQRVLEEDQKRFPPVFSAMEAGDVAAMSQRLAPLLDVEREGSQRIRDISDRFSRAMDDLAVVARERQRRSIAALLALAVLTLAVGVGVSLHTRKLLSPLARVRERAQAVARGDLTPHEAEATGDEIGELAVAFENMVGAVARAQERAVSNERFAAIGKMAAHVTHEIRNPLSSIGLNLEMLEEEMQDGKPGGDQRGLVQAIAREVERLEQISEEYLRVARLPSPRMEADDLAATVADIVDFAKPEMDRALCHVALTIETDLPPVLFDEGQIRQALVNLLRNAREAMTQGGPIEVCVRAEGMGIVISVADRGAGIPDDIRARVFDPFFSTKGQGTGLGLAITRQIIEAHGGTVSCAARDDGGTVFRLALPMAPSRSSGGLRAARPSRSGAVSNRA